MRYVMYCTLRIQTDSVNPFESELLLQPHNFEPEPGRIPLQWSYLHCSQPYQMEAGAAFPLGTWTHFNINDIPS